MQAIVRRLRRCNQHRHERLAGSPRRPDARQGLIRLGRARCARRGRSVNGLPALGLDGELLIGRREVLIASPAPLQIVCQALKLLGAISKQDRSWCLCRHGPASPRFRRLAQLRRTRASVNPLPSAKLCKTPHMKTRAVHNLARATLAVVRASAIAFQQPRQMLPNTSLIRCSRAISSA